MGVVPIGGIDCVPLKRHEAAPANRGGLMAEREGFEPSVEFPLRTLSKGVL